MHDWEPCDLYNAYIAAREETESALAHWYAAPIGMKGDAFAVYRSGADREDAAAAAWLEACRAYDAASRASAPAAAR